MSESKQKKVTKADRLEEFLTEQISDGSGTFTGAEFADAAGLTPTEATNHIRSYLLAQRRARADTLYAITRKMGTRTKNSVWEACSEPKDMGSFSRTLKSDLRVKIQGLVLDGKRMSALNPAAKKTFEKKIEVPISLLVAALEELDV